DIVVWGSIRWDTQVLAAPRFTVVASDRLRQRSYKGAEIELRQDRAGLTFQGAPPGEPLSLGAAIVGSTAFDAQRYDVASEALGRAVSHDVLPGGDDLSARGRLAVARYMVGQMASARKEAEELVHRARARGEEIWEQRGQLLLSKIDAWEGKMDSVRT